MTRIIAVVNQKGGVGKTTTSVNLAAGLARAGRNVLLIDIDPQANATSALGLDHQSLTHGIYEALSQAVPLRQTIRPTGIDGLSIVPATTSLAAAAVELVGEAEREYFLHKTILEATGVYDYILIDCPPSLGLLTINGLVAADEVLIPVQAEYLALEGLGQLLGTIDLVRENLKPTINVLGAVLTMFDRRLALSNDVMEQLYHHFPHRVFRSVIPRTVHLAEAPSYGQSIFHYRPLSKGARAYDRLSRELIDTENYVR